MARRHTVSRKLTQALGAVLLFGISYLVSAVMNAATISQPALIGPRSHNVVVVVAPSSPGPAVAAHDRLPGAPTFEPRYEEIHARPTAVAPAAQTALPL
jgi:hypothetical protein